MVLLPKLIDDNIIIFLLFNSAKASVGRSILNNNSNKFNHLHSLHNSNWIELKGLIKRRDTLVQIYLDDSYI